MPRALGVIPARYASTRFPGKPLAPLRSGTMIEFVWRRVKAATGLERVIVATDDERIRDTAKSFEAEVLLTSPDCPSGTDRVAEVVRKLPETFDVVVNIQGDEPLITPTSLDRLVEAVLSEPDVGLATLSEPIDSIEELFDPNVVKLVTDDRGRALYFSRSPIPHYRSATPGRSLREGLEAEPGRLAGYRKHQGIYAYRPEVLQRLAATARSGVEALEDLEQLRALTSGISIQVVPSDFRSCGVDTPADLDRVAQLLEAS